MLLSPPLPPPPPPPPPPSALEVRAGLFVNGRTVYLLEGLFAAELAIIWKEHYGGPFEIRQCSRILSNVGFLEFVPISEQVVSYIAQSKPMIYFLASGGGKAHFILLVTAWLF